METVALISGGKDSTFNAMHCVANGYKLVALANLKPPVGRDELDSYMYQTVGHDLLEAYSHCYQLPLYQRTIQGNPLIQSYNYTPSVDDEVEDLYELLQTVVQHHPSVKFVSVGAILSNYQRVRVENVCTRLGLVPLAWLWKQPQIDLLSSMIQNGIQAVIVKVAAMGLCQEDLGMELPGVLAKMNQISSKLGLNPCGEGGEYETITLDCPLFKQRIVIEESEQVIHKECEFAPVAYLKIKKYRLEKKEIEKEEFILNWQLPSIVDYYSLNNNNSSIDNELAFENCLFDFSSFIFTNDLSSLSTSSIAYICIICKEIPIEFDLFSGLKVPSRSVFQLKNAFIGNEQYKFAYKVIHSKEDCKFTNIQSISYWAPSSLGHFSQFVQFENDKEKNQIIFSSISPLIPQTLNVAEGLKNQFNLIIHHLNSLLDILQLTFTSISQLKVFYKDGSIEINQQLIIKHQLQSLFPNCLIQFYPIDKLQHESCLIELFPLIGFDKDLI